MSLQPTYPQFQRATGGAPGVPVDTTRHSGFTGTAGQMELRPGEALQRGTSTQPPPQNDEPRLYPLGVGGKFVGVAKARSASMLGGGGYDPGDNVPVIDAGRVWHIADGAIAAGAALNWNTATHRWTTAAASGAIVATPGVEADSAAPDRGTYFKIRIRRV